MYNRPQKLAAEFFGTFAVILFSVGAICADQFLRSTNQGSLGPLGTALAYGCAFGAMVAAAGHISGGHFNPAVTLGFWVTRRLNTFDTLAYWTAQLAGATVAAYLLRFVVPEEVWRATGLGTPSLASGLTRLPAMLIEALMAFFLVFVVFATVVDECGAPGRVAGFAAGLAVTVGVLFGGPFTGGSMNPARAFGPALASRHWTNHGVYWLGPLAGGVLAAWIYDSLFLHQRHHPDKESSPRSY